MAKWWMLFLLYLAIAWPQFSQAQATDTADIRRLRQHFKSFAMPRGPVKRPSAGYGQMRAEQAFYYGCLGVKDSVKYCLQEWLCCGGNLDPGTVGCSAYDYVKKEPWWKDFEAKAQAAFIAKNDSLKKPELAYELLRAAGADQCVRYMGLSMRNDKKLNKLGMQVDSVNLVLVRRIVAQQGFPGISEVGSEASQAMFLICQHADGDVAFQKKVLALMQKLAERNDIEKSGVAYLTDRIMVAEKKKQLYGTQFQAANVLYPIEDEAHVDERRKKMDMEPLAKYVKAVKEMNGGDK
jgi:hypothetical protein